jgi:hypothetical protein
MKISLDCPFKGGGGDWTMALLFHILQLRIELMCLISLAFQQGKNYRYTEESASLQMGAIDIDGH